MRAEGGVVERVPSEGDAVDRGLLVGVQSLPAGVGQREDLDVVADDAELADRVDDGLHAIFRVVLELGQGGAELLGHALPAVGLEDLVAIELGRLGGSSLGDEVLETRVVDEERRGVWDLAELDVVLAHVLPGGP